VPELPEVETARSLIADEALHRRIGSIAVKARLLDQSRIAGVGNLLADEILWQAKVSPAAPARAAAPRCGTGRSAAARPGGARASRSHPSMRG
jgi:formamidopyrimidine-DNA glycosylase